MIRVRFHGRGGQGIKTASRILGTAAFLEGYYVQDAPLYGAERRGAPITAFDRISKEPVLERGIITNPDIIAIGDETLLNDAAANVFQGIRKGGIFFVNTHYEASHILERYCLPECKVIVHDVTDITINTVGKASVSATLAACICRITGTAGKEALINAIKKELKSIELKDETIDKNIEAAILCYDKMSEVPIETYRFNPVSGPKIIAVKHYLPPKGVAVIYAKGNTKKRKTGNWRLFKPCINYERCVRCGICFVSCPDGCISLDTDNYPVIEYANCKGCLICYEECSAKAIETKREVRTW